MESYPTDLLRVSGGQVSMVDGFQNVYSAPLHPDGSVVLEATVEWVVEQNYAVVFYPSISMVSIAVVG
eukprot:SAG11_NODE_1635_length_4539_cov_2.188514_5_plen_68_part_00